MPIFNYDRIKAQQYAQKWALSRNPIYYNFDNSGGDCTNFASQCLYAGAPVMNYTKTFGWYYVSLNNRSPSFTGVEFFYNFLVNNESQGPFAKVVGLNEVEVGDFIQLSNYYGDYYHTLVVSEISDGIKVCTHTFDSLNRDLSTYVYHGLRCIKILGYRK